MKSARSVCRDMMTGMVAGYDDRHGGRVCRDMTGMVAGYVET